MKKITAILGACVLALGLSLVATPANAGGWGSSVGVVGGLGCVTVARTAGYNSGVCPGGAVVYGVNSIILYSYQCITVVAPGSNVRYGYCAGSLTRFIGIGNGTHWVTRTR